MQTPIILVGPMCAGKTTGGEKVAKKLNVPQCSIDEVRFSYYREIGFSKETQQNVREKQGFQGMYAYWKPFEAYAVKRILEEYKHAVIDFGAGHSVYEDMGLFQQVEKTLKPYQSLFLLLPSADKEESIQLLHQRLQKITDDKDVFELNKHFVTHPSNEMLAKQTIYTKEKSADTVAEEIILSISKEWKK
ncbi:shikimate kinase [Priestia megaterium]|uniref:shikimate kinase n=1 Tax=Priestia megaterium TaxID=1404 RepID=UPI0021D648CC|nr:shikimate kinase [Priestia megaterium]MCU7738054.1 shikimate kinase [Priestia megaterium]MCU7743465.1 shikimate kinase [Priestia megaterium]